MTTPTEGIELWLVKNDDGDCIARYRHKENALQFMRIYGSDGWVCLKNILYFADELLPGQVYEGITVDIESDWVFYGADNYQGVYMGKPRDSA